MKQKDGNLIYPSPPLIPYNNSLDYENNPNPLLSSSSSSSFSKISPILLLVIVIIAVIFFTAGLLHLLLRFLLKRLPSSSPSSHSPSPSSSSQSNDALQRQLQQLFRLHDSGLDQAFIDALPVFFYKDIMGLKEPFDCAVCLCAFSHDDKLRLLPLCSHAFHINCIDTWLLSNSTCPLCRGSLLSSSTTLPPPMENSISNFHDFPSGRRDNGAKTEENSVERQVFSVRLGKFRSLTNNNNSGGGGGGGETSRYDLNDRRCYSMGAFQYIVGYSNLQVALRLPQGNFPGNDGVCLEGKKICRRSKGESLSVSKIWLWSKKSKFVQSSSINHHRDMSSSNLNDDHVISSVTPEMQNV